MKSPSCSFFFNIHILKAQEQLNECVQRRLLSSAIRLVIPSIKTSTFSQIGNKQLRKRKKMFKMFT